MSWIIIAMFPPLLWAISNFIDKYLLLKYFKGDGLGAFLIFSSLIGTFLLPFIYLFDTSVLQIPLFSGFLIVMTGIIYVMAMFPYIHAINSDEASIIAPLFQLIPVFNYFLAYYFLNEKLSSTQMLASTLIIFGAILISLDINQKMPKIKVRVLGLMVLSSFLYAVTTLIFKFVAIEEKFWRTTFWEFVGLTIAAMVLFCIKQYRMQFFKIIKENKITFIGLNLINELITIAGRMIMGFASLLAPLALVWVVNGFQPLFVFIIGLILTIFLPHLGEESLRKRHLAQKFIAIAIMFIGAYLLNK